MLSSDIDFMIMADSSILNYKLSVLIVTTTSKSGEFSGERKQENDLTLLGLRNIRFQRTRAYTRRKK